MKKLLLFFVAFVFCVLQVGAQEKTIRVRYNENQQRLVANEQGYLVLSYDMYLYPANSHNVIGPCTVDINKDDPERLFMFYDRVQPGDKVVMKNIKVLDVTAKKAHHIADYSVILR